jgi:chromatin assembly factor 1 subunit A
MERKIEGSISVSPSTLSTLAGVTDNSQGNKVEVVPAIPANNTLPDHVTTPINPTKLPIQPKMAIKMSPELTQLLKLEAERLKLQREQLKVKMKNERDAEKKAKAEERERLKRERQEKKELLEKQREEKRLAKERAQQEKIQAKKLKEKEQQLLAADKLKKEQLSQKFFKNFFNINKLSNTSTQKDKEVQHVKTTTLNQSQMESLENHLLDQTAVSNYLCSCKGRQLKCNRRSNVNDSLELCIVDPNKLNLKFKFLKFHDNHRPPYHGTWRKKSSLISPRNPFKRDESQLDYDCDSDEEWEEEEPGETLSHSEEEMESGGEEEEDEDGFFVPHGYLSDGEGDMSDGEGGGKSSDKLSAKVKAWEAEFSRKCNQPLVPVKMGVVWTLATSSEEPTDSIRLFLSKFTAVSLVPLPITTQTCPTNQSHLALPDDSKWNDKE